MDEEGLLDLGFCWIRRIGVESWQMKEGLFDIRFSVEFEGLESVWWSAWSGGCSFGGWHIDGWIGRM